MSTRPLILSAATRAAVAQLKAHAQRNIITEAELRNSLKTGYAPWDDDAFNLVIPFGYQVVYTQEMQPKAGLCHHLSVSVEAEGMYPNEVAMETICELFGLKWKPDELWLDQENQAVNAVDKKV